MSGELGLGPKELSWRRFIGMGAGVALTGLMGCSGESVADSSGRTERLEPKAVVASNEIDIQGIAARARASFRARGDGFEAAGNGYRGVVRRGSVVIESPAAGKGHVSTAALTLGSVPVERGAFRGTPTTSAPALRADGSVSTSMGPYREVIRSAPDGLEQVWEFDEPVGERGDLVVRVSVSGQRFVSTTDTGVHFSDVRTGRGVRYGHGTWVDHAGKRTPVPAAFVDGRIVLRVPEAIVAGSEYPAALDPVIFPEFGIDVPVAGDPAYYIWHSAAARAGGTYLVAWTDGRRDGVRDIYGMRIDATSGALLDPTGFLIAEVSQPAATQPRVMANGQSFLVLWNDIRNEQTGADLYARRILADGTLLDGPVNGGGILIAGTQDSEIPMEGFFDGTNYLVTWRRVDAALTSSLRAARLDGQTGALLGGSPTSGGIELMQGNVGMNVTFATNGSNFLVTSGGRFTRLALDGTVLDSPAKLYSWVPGSPTTPNGAWNALWFDGTNYVSIALGSSNEVRATRITPSGTVLDPPDDFNLLPGGFFVCTPFNRFDYPHLFKGSAGPMLVWEGGSQASAAEAWGSRLDPATNLLLDNTSGRCGKSVGVVHQARSGGSQSFSVAAGTGGFLAFHNETGRRFKDDLTPLGPTQNIIANAARQDEAVVASNGTDFLVAWLENRADNGETDIHAARVSGDGTVLDPVSIPISTAPGNHRSLSVASNGKDYMVAWLTGPATSPGRVHGTRVSAAGAALDGAAVSDRVLLDQPFAATGEPHRTVAVGSDGPNGSGYFVVWDVAASTQWRLDGIRYDSNGAALQSYGPVTTIQIALDYNLEGTNVRVVADRAPDPALRTYLVVWEHEESSSSSNHAIRAARVRASLGRVVGTTDVATGAWFAADPAVSTDGTNFLVAWLRNNDVFGARITALDGVVSNAGFPIGTSLQVAESPALSYDGRHYWAGWMEYTQPANDGRVAATRISGTGDLLDGPAWSGAFTVSSAGIEYGKRNHADVASNAGGKVLAVYTTFDTRPNVRQTRIRARLLQDSPAEIDAGIVFKPPPPEAGSGSGGGGPVSTGGAPGTDGGDASAGGVAGTTGSGGVAGASGSGGVAGASGSGGVAGASGSGGVADASGSGGASGAGGSGGVSGAVGSGGVAGSDTGGVAGSNTGGAAGTSTGGAPADSGASGAAGAAMTGGRPGSGGTIQKGGSANAGSGSTRGTGGRAAASSGGSVTFEPLAPARDDSGCGCRVAERSGFDGGAAMLLAALGLVRRRRRSVASGFRSSRGARR